MLDSSTIHNLVQRIESMRADLDKLSLAIQALADIPSDHRRHAHRTRKVLSILCADPTSRSLLLARTRYAPEEFSAILDSLITAGDVAVSAGPRGGPRYRLTDQALARRKGELV